MIEKIISFIFAFFAVFLFITGIIIIFKRIKEKSKLISEPVLHSVLDFTPDIMNTTESSYSYNVISKEEKRGEPLEFYLQDPEPTHYYREVFGELLTFGLFKNFNPQYKIYEAIKDNNKE